MVKSEIGRLIILCLLLTCCAGGAYIEAAQGQQVQSELVLWYDKPAEEWVEALPIGNGNFGAMVFGGTAKERVQFNDDTLFTGEPHDYAHKLSLIHI